MSSRSESERLARPGSRGPLDARAEEECALAVSRRHRWYAVYLGRLYAGAVRRALAGAGETPLVLKTDLWNERLGGERDVLGRLPGDSGARCVGIDLSFAVCAHAKARTPGVRVVQADIRALPFRSAAFNALLDRYYAAMKAACPEMRAIRVPDADTLGDEGHRWTLEPFHYAETYYRAFLHQYEQIAAEIVPARTSVE